jgi:hypothetical protein
MTRGILIEIGPSTHEGYDIRAGKGHKYQS